MKQVYTLQDLASRELLDAGTTRPARLAVIGHPIAHSASPTMHQAALDAHGIDARYIRIDVEPGQVGEVFARMRDLGFIGCNVTVPHKLEAMAHCVIDPLAAVIGAVNTIRFDEDATRGFNTDCSGFSQAILEGFGSSLGELENVLIVGAGGGAGQAVATQCATENVRKLVLVNRSLGKLGPMAERLKSLNPDLEVIALALDEPSLKDRSLACKLIVNTSSVGLKTDDPSILVRDCLKRDHFVYDTIYQPPVTSLLALANEVGCRTANGLSMLIHQGAIAFSTWFPDTNPLPAMQGAMGDQKRQENG